MSHPRERKSGRKPKNGKNFSRLVGLPVHRQHNLTSADFVTHEPFAPIWKGQKTAACHCGWEICNSRRWCYMSQGTAIFECLLMRFRATCASERDQHSPIMTP